MYKNDFEILLKYVSAFTSTVLNIDQLYMTVLFWPFENFPHPVSSYSERLLFVYLIILMYTYCYTLWMNYIAIIMWIVIFYEIIELNTCLAMNRKYNTDQSKTIGNDVPGPNDFHYDDVLNMMLSSLLILRQNLNHCLLHWKGLLWG